MVIPSLFTLLTVPNPAGVMNPLCLKVFGEFLLQLFTHLIPGRAEIDAGPVIGYIKSTNQTISNGYKLTNPVYHAANAKPRLTFQI
jgi:hypothetical protein